jgi:hypothetical protein
LKRTRGQAIQSRHVHQFLPSAAPLLSLAPAVAGQPPKGMCRRGALVLKGASVVPGIRLAWLLGGGGALMLALLWAWMLGAGQLQFISPLANVGYLVTGRFWDAQSAAMLLGRLAVPCETLVGEAFVMADGCYGYFGVTPSLLRLPASLLCPTCAGGWNRVAMLAGGLLNYLFTVLIAWRLLAGAASGTRRSAWAVGFGLVAALSSSLLLVVGNPLPYYEAILWASGFSLGTLWAALRWGETGSPAAAAGMLLLCLLALHSRVTVGLGVSLTAGIALAAPLLRQWAQHWPSLAGAAARPRRWSLIGLLALGLAVASPLAVNVAKFGRISPPFERHVIYSSNPVRLARIQSAPFSLRYLGCTLRGYLSSTVDTWPRFPWLLRSFSWVPPDPMLTDLSFCADAGMENIEPFYAIYYTFPALLLLAALGWLAPVRGWHQRWSTTSGLALGAAAAAAPTFLFPTLTHRYLHDLYPLLILGGAAGLAALQQLTPVARRSFLVLLAPAVLVGFYMNFTATLTDAFSQPTALANVLALQRLLPWVINW